MILSGHQPCYLPGIIVFTKMALSDAFMFVGHCDYGDGTWHSHNFIRDVNGTRIEGEPGTKLMIPVLKKSGPSIDETVIAHDHWKRKHLASIEHAYRKRPYFNDYFPHLKATYDKHWSSLGLFNETLMRQLAIWLGIKPWFEDDYGVTGHKTDMLIEMCGAAYADEYLSSPGETYVDRERMREFGIKHHYLKFQHPVYDQGGEFIPNLSVIDLLFNCGVDAGCIVREAGSVDQQEFA